MHSQRTAGVVAALSLMMASAVSAQGGPGGMPPTAVETAQVETVTLDQSVDVIGNLRANESVTIRPEIAGRIEKIQFDEGQQVKAGDPLFTLDAALIRADLNEANANLALSQRSFDRAEDLIDRKLIAQSDYDSARSKLSVDRAKQASARTRLDKSVIRAPFSGVVGLRLTNLIVFQPLDLLTMIGFVILLGLTVNNAILLVDRTRANQREGADRDSAVRAAVAERLRPILMSTTTTLVGMLPLVLIPGPGSVIYRGLAVVIVGGMSLSLLFTLILLPALLRMASLPKPAWLDRLLSTERWTNVENQA